MSELFSLADWRAHLGEPQADAKASCATRAFVRAEALGQAWLSAGALGYHVSEQVVAPWLLSITPKTLGLFAHDASRRVWGSSLQELSGGAPQLEVTQVAAALVVRGSLNAVANLSSANAWCFRIGAPAPGWLLVSSPRLRAESRVRSEQPSVGLAHIEIDSLALPREACVLIEDAAVSRTLLGTRSLKESHQLLLSALLLEAAQCLLAAALLRCDSRLAFGAPLGKNEVIQGQLSRLRAELLIACTVLAHARARAEAAAPLLDVPFLTWTARRVFRDTLRACVDLFGAAGYLASEPVGRALIRSAIWQASLGEEAALLEECLDSDARSSLGLAAE